MSAKVAVIGSGFAGLSAAAYLAKAGCQVEVFEQNEIVGGRASVFEAAGFTFDMGPSWYWMPDVFDRFFKDMGTTTEEHLDLRHLDPAFAVWFEKSRLDIPHLLEDIYALFESIEKGAAQQLKKFLQEAEVKYTVSMSELIYSPSLSIWEYCRWSVIKGSMQLDLLTGFDKLVRQYFKDERLISIMEFPVLFLGGLPKDTPALYSMMNHAAFTLGTWYPMGGFGAVINAFNRVAQQKGVRIHTNARIEQIEVKDGQVKGVRIDGALRTFDRVVAAADYHHVEQHLLEKPYRLYDEAYWDKRVFAPSCLLYYLGLDRKLPGLHHHNLFFDTDFDAHAATIYTKKQWPKEPLFYACCPSLTDPSVAPIGNENLFLLVPLAPGLDDTEAQREVIFNKITERLEQQIGLDVRKHIIYKRSFCVSDFVNRYNAYKGNAYGLANTLNQTAVFKPKMQNPKVKGLYFAGQLTVPGPGVPPAIISGEIAAAQLMKHLA